MRETSRQVQKRYSGMLNMFKRSDTSRQGRTRYATLASEKMISKVGLAQSLEEARQLLLGADKKS